MKVKNILFTAAIAVAGSFFFMSCEKENFLEDDLDLQRQENPELKSTDALQSESQMLRHIILVDFIDEITREEKDGFTSALLDLKDSIDLIQDVEWGQDLNIQGELSKDFTHCYMLSFLTVEDLFAYLYEPALEAFHTIWLPYVKNVMVFDYMSNDVETIFTNTKRQPWLRHIVLFNYNDDITDEVRSQIVEEYTDLPTEIMHIRKMEWGNELLLLGLNMEFTDGFLLSFSGIGSYSRFLIHPERIRFVNNYVEPNVEDVLVFDYIMRKSTQKPPFKPHNHSNKDKKKKHN